MASCFGSLLVVGLQIVFMILQGLDGLLEGGEAGFDGFVFGFDCGVFLGEVVVVQVRNGGTLSAEIPLRCAQSADRGKVR